MYYPIFFFNKTLICDALLQSLQVTGQSKKKLKTHAVIFVLPQPQFENIDYLFSKLTIILIHRKL